MFLSSFLSSPSYCRCLLQIQRGCRLTPNFSVWGRVAEGEVIRILHGVAEAFERATEFKKAANNNKRIVETLAGLVRLQATTGHRIVPSQVGFEDAKGNARIHEALRRSQKVGHPVECQGQTGITMGCSSLAMYQLIRVEAALRRPRTSFMRRSFEAYIVQGSVVFHTGNEACPQRIRHRSGLSTTFAALVKNSDARLKVRSASTLCSSRACKAATDIPCP